MAYQKASLLNIGSGKYFGYISLYKPLKTHLFVCQTSDIALFKESLLRDICRWKTDMITRNNFRYCVAAMDSIRFGYLKAGKVLPID